MDGVQKYEITRSPGISIKRKIRTYKGASLVWMAVKGKWADSSFGIAEAGRLLSSSISTGRVKYTTPSKTIETIKSMKL